MIFHTWDLFNLKPVILLLNS